MATNLILPLNLGTSLDSYLQAIYKAPFLNSEEEYSLALRYRDNEDLEAARQLILSHLRYVVSVAKGFHGYGLPQADLIQEGNIGLMKAVKRFDPDRNVRLVTYAMHWIKAEIYEFIVRNWRIVKFASTKSRRKLFFNLRKTREKLGWMNNEETQQMASDLDVDCDAVRDMERTMHAHDLSFDVPNNPQESTIAPEDYLTDMRYNPEMLHERKSITQQNRKKLRKAIANLDGRSREIIISRWLHEEGKVSLGELAKRYGVSIERIRQIEKKALSTLQTSIRTAAVTA